MAISGYRIGDIAPKIDCLMTGDENLDFIIYGVNSLQDAKENDLSFLSNSKYYKDLLNSKARVVIVPEEFVDADNSGKIFLRSKNPYYSYALAIDSIYLPAKKPAAIADSAYIASSAKLGRNCSIGHNVVIEDAVEIGDDSVIAAGVFIGSGVKIGSRARIDANVSISHAIIGDDIVILPGARVGQDGFGFATHNGRHKKIYHIGKVIIGNDVEIGANSCIDRGSVNDTIIEDYCRIDNLVQIGHNVHIKKGAIIVAQAGVAGSSVVGSYAALGGQAGIAGHLKVADLVQVAAQSAILQNIEEPGIIVGGTPAVPIKQWHRQTIALRKLTEK